MGRHSHAGSAWPALWQYGVRAGNMRSCIPIEISRPMQGARHFGLNASCCGVGSAEDLAPFAELNADPDVMAHMQKTMSREESDAFVARIEEEFDDCGFGLWAVEAPNHSPSIGFVGLRRVPFDAPFTPAVEVGWRLAREHWGCGFVTEAARSAVRYGLEEVGLDEIVSFTNPDNVRSWKVMERLGMIRDPASDFEHPNVPTGHWLRPHIFYRFPPAAPSP